MKRINRSSFSDMVPSSLALLLLWCCCASWTFALDEVKQVVIYRVEMPAGIISIDELMPGLPHTGSEPAALLLQVLLEKDDCVVERLGKVAVVNGEFNLDQTKQIYYFQPNGTGDYSLKTLDEKIGLQATGKVAKNGGYYSVALELTNRTLAGRHAFDVQVDGDKAAAQFMNDAQLGMPQLNSTHLSTSLLIKPGSPMPFGSSTVSRSGPGPLDSSKRTMVYFMLLD